MTAKRPKSQVVLITRSRTKELRNVMLERERQTDRQAHTERLVRIVNLHLELTDRDPEGKLHIPAQQLSSPQLLDLPFWITHGKHRAPNNTGHLEPQRAEPSSRAGPGGSMLRKSM